MSDQPPSSQDIAIPAKARVAVVAARFNERIVESLLEGCTVRLAELGAGRNRVEIFRVPGAMELPLAAQWAARTGRFAAVICLGAVIRGGTPHFDFVAGECARGIARVALDESLPVIFGVLTTDNQKQAIARISGGRRSADAAAEMIALSKLRKGALSMANMRKIRELAVQILFLWDAQGPAELPAEELTALATQAVQDVAADESTRLRALEFARHAWTVREATDHRVEKLAPQWPTRRQPAVDRSILRLAVWELSTTETPPKVAMDEAIELAKLFSTEQSPAFVNGVLDAVFRENQATSATTALPPASIADPSEEPPIELE